MRCPLCGATTPDLEPVPRLPHQLTIVVGNSKSVSAPPERSRNIWRALVAQGDFYSADIVAATECSDFRISSTLNTHTHRALQFGTLNSPNSALAMAVKTGRRVQGLRLKHGTAKGGRPGARVRARPILFARVDGFPLNLLHSPLKKTGLQGTYLNRAALVFGIKMGDWNIGLGWVSRTFRRAKIYSDKVMHVVVPNRWGSELIAVIPRKELNGADHEALVFRVWRK